MLPKTALAHLRTELDILAGWLNPGHVNRLRFLLDRIDEDKFLWNEYNEKLNGRVD